MNRKQRRMFTASAAASLVLTVGPALVAPSGATASITTGVVAPSRASLLASSVALSRSAFRQTLRAARAELRTTCSSANSAYRLAVAPLHRQMSKQTAAAPTKSAARTIRESYGEAILLDKMELDRQLLQAQERYVTRVEQARVAYLRSVGADPTEVAHARARSAAHAASASYQVEVQRARSIHRTVTAPSRATLRAALSGAGSAGHTGTAARTEAHRTFRETTADPAAFFRATLGLAREEYRKALATAKSEYRAAATMVRLEPA